MILTVCPNPSIDCTIELDALNVGMLNRIDNKVETYSGKAMNVAIGVARLNGDCFATGFMFENHKRMFEHNLDKEGVKHKFAVCEGNARVNYKIIDKKSMLTEINDKGENVSLEKQQELLSILGELSPKANVVVISGSLPKGVDSSYYGELVKAVDKKVRIIVDTEKENMISAINDRELFMAKPNLKELEAFSDTTITSKKDVVNACRKYIDKGVRYVLVSLGAGGAVLTDGSNSYYCKSANVAVNSTVGAGDSMISATCIGLVNDLPDSEILKMAVSAGTAAVTTSGTNLFYKDKYLEIYKKLKVERI